MPVYLHSWSNWDYIAIHLSKHTSLEPISNLLGTTESQTWFRCDDQWERRLFVFENNSGSSSRSYRTCCYSISNVRTGEDISLKEDQRMGLKLSLSFSPWCYTRKYVFNGRELRMSSAVSQPEERSCRYFCIFCQVVGKNRQWIGLVLAFSFLIALWRHLTSQMSLVLCRCASDVLGGFNQMLQSFPALAQTQDMPVYDISSQDASHLRLRKRWLESLH